MMTNVTKSKIETLFDAMMEAQFAFIDAAYDYYAGCTDPTCAEHKGTSASDLHDEMDIVFYAFADANLAHSDAEEQEPVRVG